MNKPGSALDPAYTAHFAERAARTPSAIAAEMAGRYLTFAGLNARSNQLAHCLPRLSADSEPLVAVCLERSLDMLTALLSVWKAGAAYVPLDPDYPTERLAYMLSDSRASILITEKKFLSRLPPFRGTVFCLDEPLVQQKWSDSPENDPVCCAGGANLAYVMYTSGSTGKPKGVEITHRSLVNHNLAVAEAYRLRPGDRVLQFAPLSFDISVEEIFPSWLSGSTVVLRTAEAASSTARFLEFVAAERISVLNLPTAYWHELVVELSKTPLPASVRLVVIGGEKASEAAFRSWKAAVSPSVKLINTYGPTETTVTATMFEADPMQDALPIGQPIQNVDTLVLDERLQRVRDGQTGELFIGGVGLARGYRHQPELTASRFVPNPLEPASSSERLYRTGDLVRWLPDGNLEFVGRVDQQIKIRGYRIEPAEIEAALLAHPTIREAVVVAREESPGRRRLVAYIVVQANGTCTTTELMSHLRSKLPAYMIPAMFVRLNALPLNPAGKIDRPALPAPDAARPILDQELVEPRTALEEQLAGIWREVLQVKEIGVKDDFFELGGDSLLGAQVISRVREGLGVELSLQELFDAPTIAALTSKLNSRQDPADRSPATPVRSTVRQGVLPVSYMQEQLWFLHELYSQSDAYNMPSAFRIKGALNIAALERALNEVACRHESLRAFFEYGPNGLTQRVAPRIGVTVPVICVPRRSRHYADDELRHFVETEARRPFDLRRPPLFRATALRLAEDDHALVMVMHHCISDGWSLGILHHEIARYYDAFARGVAPPELPALPIQYSDFARWQRESMQGPKLATELVYWKRRLAGAPDELEFPIDRASPYGSTRTAARCWTKLPAATVEAACQLARSHKATPFMVLFAALSLALHRWTRQKDITIGTVVAGRNRREFENVVGCFMNFLPLRVELAGIETGEELLQKVRSIVLEGQEHQDCPFGRIVEALRPKRNGNRNPLYNVALLWQNFPAQTFQLSNLRITPIPVFPKDALLDLRFEAEPWGGEWMICCEYNAGAFDEQTIAQLLTSISGCLNGLTKTPGMSLDAFDLCEPRTRSLWQRLWRSRNATPKILSSPVVPRGDVPHNA